MGHAEGLPDEVVEHHEEIAPGGGHACRLHPLHPGHGLGPAEVIGAGDDGHVPVRLVPQSVPDESKGVLEVLLGGGGPGLQQNGVLGHAVGAEPVRHAGRLGDVLPGALAAGDDDAGVRVLLIVAQGADEPVFQGQGGPLPVDGGAQHDQIGPPRALVRAGVPDDDGLHHAEIGKAHRHQHQQHPPKGRRQKPVQQKQRRHEGQEIAPVGIAPHRPAEKGRRGQQPGRQKEKAAVRFGVFHASSASHCSYSSRSFSSRASRSCWMAISFW